MGKIDTKFAFIVHSRDRSDLPRKFPFLKMLPNYFFDILTMKLPPFIVSTISGLKSKEGKDIKGLVIGIPMTARQLLENRNKALKKIIQAVEVGKSRGAIFFGLGAMTASLSKGGLDVIETAENIYVTTGRTYTVINIVNYVGFCIHKFNLNKEKIIIGIVGAAGGIGSGVAILLATKGYRRFILVDLERKLDSVRIKISTILNNNSDLEIQATHKVSDVSLCDIVIAATNAPEVIIKSTDVQSGTILINDAQPSDISPDIIKNREDVLVIEGGVLRAKGINCNFNFGLANRNDIFSCLAETLIMTRRNIGEHHSIGDFNPNSISIFEEEAKVLAFEISRLQNSGGYISETRLEEFARIRTRRVKK